MQQSESVLLTCLVVLSKLIVLCLPLFYFIDHFANVRIYLPRQLIPNEEMQTNEHKEGSETKVTHRCW
jgi:hypothetical protein